MGTVSFDFKEEVVLVTGGSRGLGLEIAHAFGQAGAKVIITARRKQWLEEAKNFLTDQGIAVDAFICDVAEVASVERLVHEALQKNGKLDVLVNNAGWRQMAGTDTTSGNPSRSSKRRMWGPPGQLQQKGPFPSPVMLPQDWTCTNRFSGRFFLSGW